MSELTAKLRQLSGQENHDGEPWDTMNNAADEIERLQHEVTELSAQMAVMAKYRWKSMELAPKDGTHILIKTTREGWMNDNDKNPPCVVHWFKNIGKGAWVLSTGDQDENLYPDCWMPLHPPATSDEFNLPSQSRKLLTVVEAVGAWESTTWKDNISIAEDKLREAYRKWADNK